MAPAANATKIPNQGDSPHSAVQTAPARPPTTTKPAWPSESSPVYPSRMLTPIAMAPTYMASTPRSIQKLLSSCVRPKSQMNASSMSSGTKRNSVARSRCSPPCRSVKMGGLAASISPSLGPASASGGTISVAIALHLLDLLLAEDAVRSHDEDQQKHCKHDERFVLAPLRRRDQSWDAARADDPAGEAEGVPAEDGAACRSQPAQHDGDERLEAEQLAAVELDRQPGREQDGGDGGQGAGHCERQRDDALGVDAHQ